MSLSRGWGSAVIAVPPLAQAEGAALPGELQREGNVLEPALLFKGLATFHSHLIGCRKYGHSYFQRSATLLYAWEERKSAHL